MRENQNSSKETWKHNLMCYLLIFLWLVLLGENTFDLIQNLVGD
jgi:hypothetical protein